MSYQISYWLSNESSLIHLQSFYILWHVYVIHSVIEFFFYFLQYTTYKFGLEFNDCHCFSTQRVVSLEQINLLNYHAILI